MKCPYCNHSDTKVIDSRPFDNSTVIKRRRECPECVKRFSTYERIEDMPLMVRKSNDKLEPFDRNKLREGITRACEKRPISSDKIEKTVSEIEYELQDYVMEVPSKIIGEKVLDKMLELDAVAYIRFASVYKQYQDIDTFVEEITHIKKNHNNNNKLPVDRENTERETKGQ
jgi:transcriptional repressor NrdR